MLPTVHVYSHAALLQQTADLSKSCCILIENCFDAPFPNIEAQSILRLRFDDIPNEMLFPYPDHSEPRLHLSFQRIHASQIMEFVDHNASCHHWVI